MEEVPLMELVREERYIYRVFYGAEVWFMGTLSKILVVFSVEFLIPSLMCGFYQWSWYHALVCYSLQVLSYLVSSQLLKLNICKTGMTFHAFDKTPHLHKCENYGSWCIKCRKQNQHSSQVFSLQYHQFAVTNPASWLK